MEDLGAAVYRILKDDAAVSSQLTGINEDAIYEGLVDQAKKHTLYIRYLITTARPTNHKDGPSILDEMTVNVDCFGNNNTETKALAKACREALDRYPYGVVEGINLEGVEFLHGFHSPTMADVADKYQSTVVFSFRVGRPAYLN